ncbi:putative Phage/plasmid primase, P4 family [Candidatus Competibacter denitrificans Run_A_D11]|uniref:Phage/plasmid primase, P4 family n=1 Tax=Candidatus Competibacter denitrificans Run_A_D11 TaxID=1400863 RepID=W6M4H4_9GAMM|nr:phage/plasmid primase, P4 family [Candidatus Competibacter denitrificans]CDI01519.1 putative Phage/plasmid primase, P4 family [Candidatus Competibacter denitrificans Run_A_D11]HAS86875.1 hypothetical protein [Candidatus Competibacteraceae bacterium]HRC68576.1 phage/plasmid primase, P4 family [Candidatus Competibacter denitrificans]
MKIDTETAFRSAMRVDGLRFEGHLIADGQIHRIKVNGERNANAWYILHDDDLPAGMYGSWKGGFSHTWCAKATEALTEEEIAERNLRWQRQQAEREAERHRHHEEGRKRAQAILETANPATDDHPYLIRKGVKAHPGLLVGYWPQGQQLNSLLVPLRNAAGALATVQAIYPEKSATTGRDKDFLKGGAKSGAYFVIGDPNTSEVLLLAEGYATAATLFETTGYATVMAVDAGNLKPVTQALKNTLYPKKPLILCADNDHHTEGNPGVSAAKKARAACDLPASVALAVPAFAPEEEGSDFNDLATLHGPDAVQAVIAKALADLANAKVATERSKEKAASKVFDIDVKDTFSRTEKNKEATLATLSTFPIEIQIDTSYTINYESYTSYTKTILVYWLECFDTKGNPLLVESHAANLIAEALKGHYAFCRNTLCWHVFTQTHWRPLEGTAVLEEGVTRILYAGAPHGFRMRQMASIFSLLSKGLLPLPAVSAKQIPFTNGLLDPETKVLTPITVDNALTWSLPYAYDPAADCPTIKAWLLDAVMGDDSEEGDDPAALVEFLRAWLAALLTGRADLQRFLHLLGPGGTGKGTFIRLAEALVGQQNATITDLRNLETNRFETAALHGKRLVAITDSGKYGGSIDVLKSLTGQDPLRLERKHQQQGATFIFEGLVLIASNEALQFTDYTGAIERRRMTVDFTRRVTDAQRAAWDAQGGETAVLHREIPGVVNWALALCRSEVTRIITNQPIQVLRANREAMESGNPVADWVIQCTVPAPEQALLLGAAFEVTLAERTSEFTSETRKVFEDAEVMAYPNYRAWCTRHHRSPVATRRFSSLVLDIARTLGADVVKVRRGAGYYLKGLRLRVSADGEREFWEVKAGFSAGSYMQCRTSAEPKIAQPIDELGGNVGSAGNAGKSNLNYYYTRENDENEKKVSLVSPSSTDTLPVGSNTRVYE